MRDLKHLIYFEGLLQEANNALVKQACSEGKLALAYNCSYIPEPLLDVEGCFGVRLRAPGCVNPDLATYYMTNRSCPYSKSILERAFEGGYNFISALIGQECCTTMNRMEQYFEYCKLIPNEKFFTACIDMPIKKGDWYAGYFRRQIEKKIITPMQETYGVDYSEDKLMDAIERHNEICRLITEIGSYRKLDNPTITGYEFHIIQLVTLACPKYLIVDKLRETAEELKTREPDEKPDYRAKVMLVGLRDRRSGVYKARRDVRRARRRRPLLLRLAARQGGDSRRARTESARCAGRALYEDKRVPPRHGYGEYPCPQAVSVRYCKRV